MLQGLAAMTDAVLYVAGQLRRAALVSGHKKQRVIAEAIFAPRPCEDLPLPTALADQWGGILPVAHIHQYTLKAGAALLPHAHAIGQNLRQAEQSIRDLSGDVSGKLLLGTSHHIGLHRLPPVLRRFSSAYPQVKLDIEFMDSEGACDDELRNLAYQLFRCAKT